MHGSDSKIIAFLLLVLFLAFSGTSVAGSFPGGSNDSLYCKPLLLHFRFGRSVVDNGYRENALTLDAFRSLFSDSLSVSRVDTVIVTAHASPDGDTHYNERLAIQRARAVKGYLVWQYPHLDQRRILISPCGENWEGLRRLVEEDPSVPDRAEVLQILDRLPDARRCKELLKRLNCGYAYRYIQKNFLPQLRNATVCTVRMKRPEYTSILCGPGSEKAISPLSASSGILTAECPAEFHRYILPPVSVAPPVRYVYTDTCFITCNKGSEANLHPFLALKTNLLFDVALAPNIELELPLGKRWSLNAEWMFPWWLTKNHKYCFQLLSGGLEGRYWLGERTDRRLLTGHFLGLYAGGGKYDLQWKDNGYQGEFYIASGVSYGYVLPVARRLNLELSIGVGLLRTNYEHYHAINDYRTLLWQNNGTYTWFGPTKAKISLVWLLGGKEKGGER